MKINPPEMFKVLGVETRLKIIALLKSNGPLGVKNISKVLNITPAAVSQHLKILRQAGLVKNERKGYWIPYSINEEALENCRCMLNEVCTCGCKITDRYNEKEINKKSLKSLIKYKKELKKELDNVRKRISEIKSQEN